MVELQINRVRINHPFLTWNDRNLEKISKKLWIKWNFELTMLELTVPDLYNSFSFSFATFSCSLSKVNFRKQVSKELMLQESTIFLPIETYRNWMTRYGNWFTIVVKSPNPRSKEICSHKSCHSSQSMYSTTSRKILKYLWIYRTLWNCSAEKILS